MVELQGHLLVADPGLHDPNFFHSVVLLVRHSEEGAFGVVLNRESGTTLSEAWQQIGEEPCDNAALIHVGGPIAGPLMAVHAVEELGETEVVPGVFFSAGAENLERLVTQSQAVARYIIGYAGWGAGQLEGEIEAGAWLTLPATAERVFRGTDEYWEAMIRAASDSRLQAALRIKHVPPDPRVN